MRKLIPIILFLLVSTQGFAQSTKFRKGVDSAVPIITPSNQTELQEQQKQIAVSPYLHFNLTSKPYKITFSGDSDYLAVSTKDGTLEIFDVQEKAEEFSGSFSPSPLYSADFHPTQRLIALGDRDGIVTVFDMIRREPVKIIYELASSVSDVKYSPDATILAAVHFGGDITFYDTANYTLIDKIMVSDASIYALNFSTNSLLLAIADRANTVKIIEVGAANPSAVFKDHSSFVLTCDWSSNNWLASGGADAQLFVYHKDSGQWQNNPYFSWVHNDWVTAVKFYRNYLFTGSKEGRIRLFDFTNRELLAVFDVNAPVLGIDIQNSLMGVITTESAEVYRINDILESIY